MKRSVKGTIEVNSEGFVIVKVHLNNIEYRIENWFGTKKKFGITKKDLPLLCKGIINHKRKKIFNTWFDDKCFTITKVYTSVIEDLIEIAMDEVENQIHVPKVIRDELKNNKNETH